MHCTAKATNFQQNAKKTRFRNTNLFVEIVLLSQVKLFQVCAVLQKNKLEDMAVVMHSTKKGCFLVQKLFLQQPPSKLAPTTHPSCCKVGALCPGCPIHFLPYEKLPSWVWLRGAVAERWSLTSDFPWPVLDLQLTPDHLPTLPSTIG